MGQTIAEKIFSAPAKRKGAKTLSLTDSMVSALAAHSDYLFMTRVDSPTYFNSHAAANSVIKGLIMAVTLLMGKRSVKKLMDGETFLKEWGVYISD